MYTLDDFIQNRISDKLEVEVLTNFQKKISDLITRHY